MDTALQIRLKRAFVSVQVIRRESDQDLKFHMFKRLNDGGTPISRQQVRNCIVRMLEGGARLMDFIRRLSEAADYRTCCVESLSEEQLNDQFDQELILRFFALKNNRKLFKHDLAPFFDEFAEKIAGAKDFGQVFDYAAEESVFKKTFRVLAESTGELSFTFPNRWGDDLTKGFSAYHFEGVTLGLQESLPKLDPGNRPQMEKLREALRTVRLSQAFKEVSAGGGKNSPGPLNRRVKLISDAVTNLFG